MNKAPLTLAVAAVLLAACQTAPMRNAMLDDARLTVARVRGDDGVVRMAPNQLADAEAALIRAENAWVSGAAETDVRHLSYLALQRASIAENIAAARIADVRTRQTLAARDRLAGERATLIAQVVRQRELANAEAARQDAARDAELDEALQRQLALIQGYDTGYGKVVSLQDRMFLSGRELLRGSGERTAERIAEILREHPDRRVMISGLGMSSDDLAQRRARIVREALVANGVSPERIEVPGAAELRGYTGESTATAARGVDVLFSDAQGQFATR